MGKQTQFLVYLPCASFCMYIHIYILLLPFLSYTKLPNYIYCVVSCFFLLTMYPVNHFISGHYYLPHFFFTAACCSIVYMDHSCSTICLWMGIQVASNILLSQIILPLITLCLWTLILLEMYFQGKLLWVGLLDQDLVNIVKFPYIGLYCFVLLLAVCECPFFQNLINRALVRHLNLHQYDSEKCYLSIVLVHFSYFE